MIKYVKELIVPYVIQKRDDLNLDSDHPSIAIFDHFKSVNREGYTIVRTKSYSFCAYSSCIYWGVSAYGHFSE